MNFFSGELAAGFGLLTIVGAGLPTVLMIVALVYVALRVRDARSDTPDPDLGLKTVYWMLYTFGVLTFHVGLTVLAVHVVQGGSADSPPLPPVRPQFPLNIGQPPPPPATEWSAVSRTGWAFITAGVVVAGAFYLTGTRGTRNREWPTVQRVFTGGRIALAGTVSILAFLALIVIVFQKDEASSGVYETCLGILAVWLPSLAIHIFLFRWGGTPPYHVPAEVPTPRRPTVMPEELPEIQPAANEPEQPRPRRRSDDETDDFRRFDDEDEQPRRRRPRDED
ncbi:hypothetical protein [Limnoglobus roseus]|uniref:DUF5671 domain-containing protein n=1 Tax=Limnoglobus roseus TaxID=2598579 RepID=A0A5C1ADL1_9BACT|nr:hypothetical protein [Limnoglobus roseus]QEL16086.1 hypothetical protein PX52LOC_03025 [Limnoglobus roseus]